MIIINENTSQRLLYQLQLPEKGASQEYLLMLPLGTKQHNKREELLSAIILLIWQEPCAKHSSLYLFEDGDIAFAFQQWDTVQGHIFIQHVQEVLAEQSIDAPVALFHLRNDNKKLQELCRLKITQLRKSQQQSTIAAQQHITTIWHEQAVAACSANRVASIHYRRTHRDHVQAMVADDDQLCRTLVCSLLEKECSTSLAMRGRDVLLQYIHSAPDILFLDIGLPDIEGHHLINAILSIDTEAFIVMLSGKSDKENVLRTMECGAKGFIAKPFTKAGLLTHVQKSPHVIEKHARQKVG
jgi:CheY-like chemotaxis protein